MAKKEKTKSKYDPRNRLNNLTGSEWMSNSTSLWTSNENRSSLEISDLKRIIKVFSKKSKNIKLVDFNYIKNKSILGRNIVNQINDKKPIDYIIVNNPFIKIKDIKSYNSKANKILLNLFNITKTLKVTKYITFFIQEKKINGVIPNVTYHLSEYFTKNGFKFKGKVNLIFKNGSHSYLIHFKKNEGISYDEHRLNLNIELITNSLDKIKDGYGVIRSHVKLDSIGKQHPAPYSPEDIKKLLELFTNERDVVLDPFVGVGSTTVAAISCNRKSIGIDLNNNYIKLAKERTCLPKNNELHQLINGDSLKIIKDIDSVNYCVTSPPYHNILRNKGNGIRHDDSQFRQGVNFYSEEKNDLGNQDSFEKYLLLHKDIMQEVFIKLESGSYCSIIVSDFTVDKIEQNVVGKIINDLEKIGYFYIGTMLLTQNNKAIYPFGYPYDYVINHVNQYIVNFYKK